MMSTRRSLSACVALLVVVLLLPAVAFAQADAPTGVAIVPGVVARSVVISWTAPSGFTAAAGDYYAVQYKVTTATAWTSAPNLVATATSLRSVVLNLDHTKTYQAQVRLFDKSDTTNQYSSWAASSGEGATATPLAPNAPTKMAKPTVTVGNAQLRGLAKIKCPLRGAG